MWKSTRDELQCAKCACQKNYKRRRTNVQLCSTFEVAQIAVSRGSVVKINAMELDLELQCKDVMQ